MMDGGRSRQKRKKRTECKEKKEEEKGEERDEEKRDAATGLSYVMRRTRGMDTSYH